MGIRIHQIGIDIEYQFSLSFDWNYNNEIKISAFTLLEHTLLIKSIVLLQLYILHYVNLIFDLARLQNFKKNQYTPKPESQSANCHPLFSTYI